MGPYIDWIDLTQSQMQKPDFDKGRFWAEFTDAQNSSQFRLLMGKAAPGGGEGRGEVGPQFSPIASLRS
jgi:hypothetical protein